MVRKTPTDQQFETAIMWLQGNEGDEGEGEACRAGRTQTLAEWGRETGINTGTLGSRIDAGWSIKQALTKRVRSCGRE
jgi:hypothetical protein